jgi:transcriptional regulator with XRE-family HTH domain
MTQFNERLKALRKSKDLTQEQTAEYLGVSPQAVSRWECGATCPDISALPQLAELFNITVTNCLVLTKKKSAGKSTSSSKMRKAKLIKTSPMNRLHSFALR